MFVDVEAIDFLMSPTSLEAAIQDAVKKGLRPKVVIPVDLFGQPADYAAIDKIARNNDLFALADSAQRFGGARDGKRVGTLARVTATSFFPPKPQTQDVIIQAVRLAIRPFCNVD